MVEFGFVAVCNTTPDVKIEYSRSTYLHAYGIQYTEFGEAVFEACGCGNGVVAQTFSDWRVFLGVVARMRCLVRLFPLRKMLWCLYLLCVLVSVASVLSCHAIVIIDECAGLPRTAGVTAGRIRHCVRPDAAGSARSRLSAFANVWA